MDKYMQSLDVPNNKNVSKGMQGVFGSSGGGDTGGGYGGNQGYGGPGGQNYFPDIWNNFEFLSKNYNLFQIL